MTSLQEFYGLTSSPFINASDPDIFFESQAHREALALLQYGIEERKGLLLITGEVGTGKTTLCKTLIERLPQAVKSSLVLNPYFSDIQLLLAVIEDFGLTPEKRNRLDIVKRLDAFLIEQSLQGGNAVLLIDEAQNLKPRQLEQLRLLSNLETKHGKLLQIVLFGQPELTANLKRHELRQIYQRVAVKYNLRPLDSAEIKDYIDFRFQRSGNTDAAIPGESFEVIFNFSKGIPRLINLLCDRALLLGFVRQTKKLTPDIFLQAMEEIL